MSSPTTPPQVTRPDEFVIVLDFGAQYSQLIARRIRECKVYCELLPFDTPVEELAALKPSGIVFSGGPASVYEDERAAVRSRVFSTSGCRFWASATACSSWRALLGGQVVGGEKREYGRTELRVLDGDDLFAGLNPQLICWMSHGDVVTTAARRDLPRRPSPIIRRWRQCPTCERRLFGVQFHPEVVHTPWGIEILRNFLYRYCGCTGTMDDGEFRAPGRRRDARDGGRRRVWSAG